MAKKVTSSSSESTVKSGVKKVASESKTKAVASKSTTAKKKVSQKVISATVPVKDNVNPIDEVLKIKAKNDEKKAKKSAGKVLATNSDKKVKSLNVVDEKGNKAKANRQSKAVKDKAQKSATNKQLSAIKENLTAKKSCFFCKDGMLAAFGRAFKNIFNYKGRTSRYELWAFNLCFLILTLVALPLLSILINLATDSLVAIAFTVLGLALIYILVMIALTVRRIHDAGYSAWKDYFKPFLFYLFMCIILLIGFKFIDNETLQEHAESHGVLFITAITIYILILLSFFFGVMYYSTKIGIVSAFFEPEMKDNIYGELRYADEKYKTKTLKYIVLFSTIGALIHIIWSAIQMQQPIY